MITHYLGWLAGPGWRRFWRDKGTPFDEYRSAEQYRQRHLTDTLTAITRIAMRR